MEQHTQSRFLATRTLLENDGKSKGTAGNGCPDAGCGTLGKNNGPKTLPEAGRRPLNQQAQNRFLVMPAHYGGHAAGWLGGRNTILDGTDANVDGVMAGQRIENRGVRRTAFQLCFYLRDLIGAPGFN
jgi:hypothetical protein